MRTIKLIIEYDGTNYCGWQRQKNGVSIQETILRALHAMTREDNTLVGASRTDAGVHALGQAAHFTTSTAIPCEGFLRGLNSLLPNDIRIRCADEMERVFHALKDAKGKTYRYVIQTDAVSSALYRHRAWHVPSRIDLAAMRSAAAALIGRHDFAAFQASGSSVRGTVRTIHDVSLRRVDTRGAGPALIPCPLRGIELDITGNGFLRHMVRTIVGTLVGVGQGKLKPNDMGRIIAGRKRIEAGVCAPASGLYLVRVFY